MKKYRWLLVSAALVFLPLAKAEKKGSDNIVAACSEIKFQLGETAMAYHYTNPPRRHGIKQIAMDQVSGWLESENSRSTFDRYWPEQSGSSVKWVNGCTYSYKWESKQPNKPDSKKLSEQESRKLNIIEFTFNDNTVCLMGYTQKYPDLLCTEGGKEFLRKTARKRKNRYESGLPNDEYHSGSWGWHGHHHHGHHHHGHHHHGHHHRFGNDYYDGGDDEYDDDYYW
ncbi:MAG: hypothetical protein ACR2PT_13110 [Endozoicomonas sp.]